MSLYIDCSPGHLNTKKIAILGTHSDNRFRGFGVHHDIHTMFKEEMERRGDIKTHDNPRELLYHTAHGLLGSWAFECDKSPGRRADEDSRTTLCYEMYSPYFEKYIKTWGPV